jgi:hypothetical protein
MVYTSSIQSVKEMLQASITAYNQKKATLYDSLFNDSEHSESWKSEQKQRKQEELKNEYASNLVDIQNRLTAARNDTALQVGRIKFPSSTSSLEAIRTAGEVQQNTAQLFLMREHSHAGILSSIRNALTLGRVDYAFALIEGAREAVKPVNGMLSQEGKQFLQDLAQIEQGFDATGKLGALAGELENVPEIAQTIQHFGAFLTNEHLTGGFIPMAVVREMTEAEIGQNLESVNFVVSLGSQ